jgi:small conductance mechanosensitive channel
VVLRLVVKTRPAEQFPVMRELRRRLSDEFQRRGIHMPMPERSVLVQRDAGTSHESPELPAVPTAEVPAGPTAEGRRPPTT